MFGSFAMPHSAVASQEFDLKRQDAQNELDEVTRVEMRQLSGTREGPTFK